MIIEGLIMLGWGLMYPFVKLKDGFLYAFVPDERDQYREQRQDKALSVARQKVGAQVSELERKLRSLREDEKKYLQQALSAKKRNERSMALSSMKLLQKVRKDIAVVDTALQSAEKDLSQIDHTSVVRDVVASKREVRKAVGKTKLSQLASETETLVDANLDASEQLENIEATLQEVVQSVTMGEDDDSLMAELDALEEAELDAQLKDIQPPSSDFHDACTTVPETQPEPEQQQPLRLPEVPRADPIACTENEEAAPQQLPVAA